MKIILLVLIAAGTLYSLYSIICVLAFFRGKKTAPPLPDLPPVSILKPVKGVEPGLHENIKSFCLQDYPEYEVLLGSEEDISALSNISSKVPLRTILINRSIGSNRKVSNLQGLLEASNYPMVAMSDADMRVNKNYLETIILEFFENRNAGMVTSLYKISAPESLGAALESLTIALDFIPSVLVARSFEGITFGLGASMLVSKEALDSIGGLYSVADHLADDYQIGNRISRKGYRIVLSNYVIETVIGKMGLAGYFRHQLRWARTYRASRPAGFLGFGITHVLFFSLLLLLTQGPSVVALSVFFFVLAMRFGEGLVLFKKVIRDRKWLKWLALIPLKDVFSFCIWVASFLGKKVAWKENTYRILKGGRMEKI